MSDILSAQPVLDSLMDFQRDTVEYAFHRLFEAPDSTDRFLVADEVGLGKTMVARGVAAKTIEHLQRQGVKRIDIIYVCSNAAIAQQNVSRLRMPGISDPVNLDRLTMLALNIDELNNRDVSLVAFTPGTSFQVKNTLGRSEERALVMALLEHPNGWGRHSVQASGRNVMRGHVKPCNFDWTVKDVRRRLKRIHENQPATCFWERLAERPDLLETWNDLRHHYARSDSRVSQEVSSRRLHLIGQLRHLLAAASLDALEPDLIILDEFQRFTHLLREEGDDAELARELFDWTSAVGHERARVLMLSATPYKMFTLDSERASDDHYRDLLETLSFLCRSRDERVSALSDALSGFSSAIDSAARDTQNELDSLLEARSELEGELQRVMCRTERLSVTADKGGLLAELSCPDGVDLTPADVSGYVTMKRVANALGQPDPAEYWKSIPYPLTFLHNYQYRVRLDAALDTNDLMPTALLPKASMADNLTLPIERIEGFGEIDLSNPRLRSLARDTTDADAARALWVPPALPYYELSAPFSRLASRGFTKRLVFSAWTAIPRAAASLLSYEAERQAVAAAFRGKSIEYSNPSKGSPIRFELKQGKVSGLHTWTWLYPFAVLGEATDPLRLWQQAGESPTAIEMLELAEAKANVLLARLPALHGHPTARPGQADSAWYWLAPLLLDAASSDRLVPDFLNRDRLRGALTEHAAIARNEMSDQLLDEVIAVTRRLLDDPQQLGPVPDDLARVLAYVGLAGAATSALRALSRECDIGLDDPEARMLALAIGSSIRDMFNRPHCVAAVRCSKASVALKDKPYWLRAIAYAFTGCIQSMLDEYVHVLSDSPRSPQDLTRDILTALGVGAVSVEAVNPGRSDSKRLRTHHAAAFGLGRASDDAQTERTIHLREAFNSPFKPFSLISTSVGQEGLDFHKYCHAIVHWNLPSSPVDFEQREGRVHRFKGHAVRKNVVADHADAAKSSSSPWRAAFDAAAHARSEETCEMVPFWVYPEQTDPERHALIIREVPALPLSKDALRRQQLQRTLGAYRMVFGQPRQEDLIEYLLTDMQPGTVEAMREAAAIRLGPPRH